MTCRYFLTIVNLCVPFFFYSGPTVNRESKKSNDVSKLNTKAKNPEIGKLTEADKASTGRVCRVKKKPSCIYYTYSVIFLFNYFFFFMIKKIFQVTGL